MFETNFVAWSVFSVSMQSTTRFLALMFALVFSVCSAYAEEKLGNILERKVTLHVKNSSLMQIGALIEKQEGINMRFLFARTIANQIIPEIKVEDTSLADLLRLIRKLAQVEIYVDDSNQISKKLSHLSGTETEETDFLPATGIVRITGLTKEQKESTPEP
jgi:hypothetical protein